MRCPARVFWMVELEVVGFLEHETFLHCEGTKDLVFDIPSHCTRHTNQNKTTSQFLTVFMYANWRELTFFRSRTPSWASCSNSTNRVVNKPRLFSCLLWGEFTAPPDVANAMLIVWYGTVRAVRCVCSISPERVKHYNAECTYIYKPLIRNLGHCTLIEGSKNSGLKRHVAIDTSSMRTFTLYRLKWLRNIYTH